MLIFSIAVTNGDTWFDMIPLMTAVFFYSQVLWHIAVYRPTFM